MFGDLVRAHRRRLGLTQEDVAALAGLSERTIRKIEGGRVIVTRPTTARLLADAFGLTGIDRETFCRVAAGDPVDPPAQRAPAQLPPDVSAFTGRAAELSHLDTLVAERGDRTTAMPIRVLCGGAGVGKTALTVHWAHRVRNRFPDGQLYLDLRGHDGAGPLAPADALNRFLHDLGVADLHTPARLDDLAARYRSELADRRVLVVLDDAASADQVRPLLPGAPSCAVLVTSRDPLAALIAIHGARRLPIGLLPPEEAIVLLRRVIGCRLDAEPAAAAALIQYCARLPLALRIVAELAAARPGQTLTELVGRLSRRARWLDRVDAGDELGLARRRPLKELAPIAKSGSPEVADSTESTGQIPAAYLTFPFNTRNR